MCGFEDLLIDSVIENYVTIPPLCIRISLVYMIYFLNNQLNSREVKEVSQFLFTFM